MEDLVIYCADVGSIREGNFAWARAHADGGAVEEQRGGGEIVELVEEVAADLDHRPVALGFECPLFVPVPEDFARLGAARIGEGGRAWSVGAGVAVLGTGLAQVPWVLGKLRARRPTTRAFLRWEEFDRERSGLFLWEAFVSGAAKGESHRRDAEIAVETFRVGLPDPTSSGLAADPRVLSLLGAALLWSGFADDLELIREPCLLLRT